MASMSLKYWERKTLFVEDDAQRLSEIESEEVTQKLKSFLSKGQCCNTSRKSLWRDPYQRIAETALNTRTFESQTKEKSKRIPERISLNNRKGKVGQKREAIDGPETLPFKSLFQSQRLSASLNSRQYKAKKGRNRKPILSGCFLRLFC